MSIFDEIKENRVDRKEVRYLLRPDNRKFY